MPILCKIYRGDFIESIHVAYAVVVNEKGDVVFASGDPEYITCARSVLKPFQAAATVKSGATKAVGFIEEELALMCASHNGEEIHVKTAKSMLGKLELTVESYECGTHSPYHKGTRDSLLAQGKEWTALHNNCSGKHAGMLCLARHLEGDITGYTRREHPVQEHIFNYLQSITGLKRIPHSIDGCSAPTPFLSLKTVAGLFQKLVSGNDPTLDKLFTAMTNHPYIIAGEKRFDTTFNEVMSGRAVTKVGGEAIRGIGIRTDSEKTWGMALKVLDGTQRAAPVVALAVLNHLNLLHDEEKDQLNSFSVEKLYNHRMIHIGNITAEVEP